MLWNIDLVLSCFKEDTQQITEKALQKNLKKFKLTVNQMYCIFTIKSKP